MNERIESLTVVVESLGEYTLLTVAGELDSRSYRGLRDRIIKAALEEPAAVIIDISNLEVPAESALAVFTSARWHVNRWPEVPLILVCRHHLGRSALRRNGVGRYLPVYASIEDAVEGVAAGAPPQKRRRVREELPHLPTSLLSARDMVEQWLTVWSCPEMISVAKIVVTTFVENVLEHTESKPDVRLETNNGTVTVAVADDSTVPAAVREQDDADRPSGLKIVAALSRMWGVAPTPNGKTVWAVIGPENKL